MTELVIVRAVNEVSLIAEVRRIVAYLDRVPNAALADVAYTCSFLDGPEVLSVVAETVADLRTRLTVAADRIAAGNVARIRDKSGTYWFREHLLGPGQGKLAFVYPGVMSFYPDMLRDLAILHPVCRTAFDELEEALAGGEFTPSSFIFSPAAHYRHDADIFSSGAYAQAMVATYAACVALSRLLADDGVKPDGVVGFGGGDLAAHIRAGFAGAKCSRQTRIDIIRKFYSVVDKAVSRGGLPDMAMVSLLLRHPEDAELVLAQLPPGAAVLATDFSPRQKTYALSREYENQAIEAFSAAGIRTIRLALNRPFNTPLSESLVPAVHKFVDGWMREEPTCEVYSCATADRLPERLRKARAETAERWAKPVRFAETIRKMYADGYRVFLEVGPRGLMTSAIEDTLREVNHAAIQMNSLHRRGVLQTQHALAHLAALGASADVYKVFMNRGARKLEFDSAFAAVTRRESEMVLSRAFPRLTFLSDQNSVAGASALAEPQGRGAKANLRAAALAAKVRRERQFETGARNPLVSDADTIKHSPGISLELHKVFRISEAPFLSDFAIGNSQLSYSDKALKGLIPLALPVAAEIMAETAAQVVPNCVLAEIENLTSHRVITFAHGQLGLSIVAERVSCTTDGRFAVKVQLRDDAPGRIFTVPAAEATFVFAREQPQPQAVSFDPLTQPRSVHWSGRDIYPSRICCGNRLKGISFVETWSMTGLDYEIDSPDSGDSVAFTRFPLWLVNPLLLQMVVNGFSLWRSHERFTTWRGAERMDDAYSFPFRLRRLVLHAPMPDRSAKLRCYLRLTGVTPKTHICDIVVSDGNGSAMMTLSGWEEYVQHVRSEYRSLILQPATSFITSALEADLIGANGIEVSSAFITNIPYPAFARDDEIWLKTISHIVLGETERGDFERMPGTTDRRTEWLFGRIAAKESVRRYLRDYCQARWSYADVTVHADDLGKPYVIGEWQDQLPSRLEIAISHTANFVIALAASNAHVGVDVESVTRPVSEGFAEGVFSPAELALAAAAPQASHASVRFWCAKEAVSKTLGCGIRYNPKEMVITRYEADANRITIQLEGGWADAYRRLKGRDITVTVRNFYDHVLAICLLPSALFNEE